MDSFDIKDFSKKNSMRNVFIFFAFTFMVNTLSGTFDVYFSSKRDKIATQREEIFRQLEVENNLYQQFSSKMVDVRKAVYDAHQYCIHYPQKIHDPKRVIEIKKKLSDYTFDLIKISYIARSIFSKEILDLAVAYNNFVFDIGDPCATNEFNHKYMQEKANIVLDKIEEKIVEKQKILASLSIM